VQVRLFGEGQEIWGIVFNIQMDGIRQNCPNTRGYGLCTPATGYYLSNDASTPDVANFSTLISTSSVIGTDITFRVVVDADGNKTYWYNRCFDTPSTGAECGTSELIITEIKGE